MSPGKRCRSHCPRFTRRCPCPASSLFLDLQILGDARHAPSHCPTWAIASCTWPLTPLPASSSSLLSSQIPDISLGPLQPQEFRGCPPGPRAALQSSQARTHQATASHDPALTTASQPGGNRPWAENSSSTFPTHPHPSGLELRGTPARLPQAKSYPSPRAWTFVTNAHSNDHCP